MFGIGVFMWTVASLLQNAELSQPIIRILDIIGFVLFPISFIMFLIMIINMFIKPPIRTSSFIEPKVCFCCENLPLKSIACFVISFVSIFVIGGIKSSSLRNTVKAFLNDVSAEVKVKVNREWFNNPKEIVEVLKKVQPLPAHHSHSTTPIHIEVINDTRSLSIELGRDSQRPQEYWVFYPALFSFTTKIEIGGIVTDLFDGY
jgi:hypothetical protein